MNFCDIACYHSGRTDRRINRIFWFRSTDGSGAGGRRGAGGGRDQRGAVHRGAQAARRQRPQRAALRRPAQLRLRGRRQHRRLAVLAGLR